MDTRTHLVVVLLVTCAWPFLVGSLARGAASLHPVILLPGYGCSQLDARLTDAYKPAPTGPNCGALKGKGWFRLWEPTAQKENPALAPCYGELLRIVYDPVAGDYHNLPGVETRVVSFNTTRGFGADNPGSKIGCMGSLVKALEGVGYKEGANLFGAPYDYRYAPAPPGQAAKEFSGFVSQLTALVEQASAKNGGMPVIIVTHSLGGINANVFLSRSPPAWRKKYIKHFVMVSTGAGGGVFPLQFGGASSAPFATSLSVLPSPRVFGLTPVVVTRAKNYSAYDIPEYLKANGFSDEEVARYKTRVLPMSMNFSAPGVPMTCMNGVGVPTPEMLVYPDGDFRKPPQVVTGDGDGGINIASISALDKLIGADPSEKDRFKSILLNKTNHVAMISDPVALKRLVDVVLEASRAKI